MRLKRILKGSQVAEIDKKCINDGIDSKWTLCLYNSMFHNKYDINECSKYPTN